MIKTNSKKESKFPLIPFIKSKPKDKYNANHFYFKWLIFRFWLLEVPSFSLELVASEHWGIGAIGTLPYLRWCVTILLPGHWDEKVRNRFKRHIIRT